MLILCYGITKSGSTLAFELVKGMLESVGHPQERLPGGLVLPGHSINFIDRIDGASMSSLLAAIPPEGFVTVKTHAQVSRSMFARLEELQEQRKVQIVASYRDPRDICLSLVDAGAKARAKGSKAFSEFTDLASTVPAVERQLVKFRKWASIRGALRLSYDMVAFAPDDAIDALERVLGIVCDRNFAKKYAFENAFTQKNRAVRNRYINELTEQQALKLSEVFGEFIRRVCVKNDDRWFSSFREKFLSNPRAENV